MAAHDDPTEPAGEQPGSEFTPDARQRRLIEAAERLNRESVEAGHFIPEELQQRMQAEADVGVSAAPCLFYVTMGAAIDEAVSPAALEKLLGPEFDRAKLYWRRPFILAVERLVEAGTRLEATLKVAADIRRVFPRAEMVDMSGLPKNLIAALDEMAEQGALPEMEPGVDVMGGALRVHELRGETASWAEAVVFEVLDERGLVHLRASDERIFSFTRGTNVWNGFEKVEEDQRFRCLVMGRSGVVLRAERLLV